MSSRALRKAQREKEEQDRLKQLESEAQVLEDDDKSEDDMPTSVPKKSAFAMLQENDDDEDTEDPDEDTIASDIPATTPAPQASSKKKKKKKKSKAVAEDTEDLDEIDAALKALSTSDSSHNATTTAGIDEVVNETSRLLAIDSSHLHAQNEMRRLFGRAALQQDEDERPPPEVVGGNRRQHRRAQQVGLAQVLRGQRQDGRSGLAAMALRRNIFIQGKEDWPVATGGGLGMEVEEKRADGTVLYRYVHNSGYQDVQSQFETCVASMDPNRMVNLLRLNPYHISTLLQVSEIAKQDRDHATSGDLLERALFSFGRAVHSTFSKSLADGKARLDFRRAENREFWLASWRYMQNLTMRATWRTVFEWAKLLLSLAPEDDPYALWLVLDQYALRSRQDLDYLNISRNPAFKAVHHDMPNVQLSQGLAEYRAGNKGKGKQALFAAMGRFPWVIARLMQELNVDPPPGIWGKEPRSEKEKLHAELYATKAKDLWNTPETSSLLIEIASALPPDAPTAPVGAEEITRNEARHILLLDTPALIAFVPRRLTVQLESASDPLPPEHAYPSYLEGREPVGLGGGNITDLNHINDSIREIRDLQQFFAEIIPWFGRPRAGEDDNDGHDLEHAQDPEMPGNTEDLMRRVEEHGVSRETFYQRARRLLQIQDQLFGGTGETAANAQQLMERFGVPGTMPEDEDDDPAAPHHARVEDAPEED